MPAEMFLKFPIILLGGQLGILSWTATKSGSKLHLHSGAFHGRQPDASALFSHLSNPYLSREYRKGLIPTIIGAPRAYAFCPFGLALHPQGPKLMSVIFVCIKNPPFQLTD